MYNEYDEAYGGSDYEIDEDETEVEEEEYDHVEIDRRELSKLLLEIWNVIDT